jgi:protein-disulfide isomerase/uncharacterized membrane protein
MVRDDSAPAPGLATPLRTARSAPGSAFAAVIWVLILLCCAGGLYVTRELARHHRSVEEAQSGLSGWLCSPDWGETVSCDQVLQSPWASLRVKYRDENGNIAYQHIPYAWLGIAYFASLGIWFLFVGVPSPSRWYVNLFPLGILVPGIGASVFFLYILATKLPATCPLCLTTHLLNGLIFLGSLLVSFAAVRRRRRFRREGVDVVDPSPNPTARQLLTTGALMIAVVLLMLRVQSSAQTSGHVAMLQKRLAAYEANPKLMWEYTKDLLRKAKVVEIPVDPDDPILGPPDAKRTLVVFSDYQCPACRKIDENLLKLFDQLQEFAAPSGGLRMVFKHYPLYARCNPRANTNAHAFSCDAAKAAEAARIVGGDDAFWAMGRMLFEHQSELYRAPYEELAKEIGLDPVRFAAAYRSKEAAERVARHVEEGAAAGMVGTPGLYLDGVNVSRLGNSGPSIWKYVLSQRDWPPR